MIRKAILLPSNLLTAKFPQKSFVIQSRGFCALSPKDEFEEKLVKLHAALRSVDIRDLMDPVKGKQWCKDHNLDPAVFEEFLNQQRKAPGKRTMELTRENMDSAKAQLSQQEKEDESSDDGKYGEDTDKERKWIVFFGLLLLCILAVYEYKVVYDREANSAHASTKTFTYSNSQIAFAKMLPTRLFSSLWGRFTNLRFPAPIQYVINSAYASAFGCILEEAEYPITEYESLADFFKRNLKPGVRPVDTNAQIICPVDGRLVHYGKVDSKNATIEQVKGIDFSLAEFMGENSAVFTALDRIKEREEARKLAGGTGESLGTQLYYCVIYLAPGDYHGYHSPVDWKINERIHFPGYLFPVAGWAVNKIRDLFAMNERVVLNGEWKHGFFSYTPVGAYNVGSMKFNFDELVTNRRNQRLRSGSDRKEYVEGEVSLRTADNIGFFNLGSSVVMIFESPPLLFSVPKGGQIKLGQALTMELTPQLAKQQLDKLLQEVHQREEEEKKRQQALLDEYDKGRRLRSMIPEIEKSENKT